MTRNALAVGAMVLVGGSLWVVMAWPAPADEAFEAFEPTAVEDLTPAPPPPSATDKPAPPVQPPQPPPAAPSPPPPSAEPALAQEPPAQPSVEMFMQDEGPVADYKRAYESEPRDSAANEVESTIRAAFAHPDGTPELFKSVLCRQSVCKLELNWSQERMAPYIAGITRAIANMNPTIAVAPAGPAGADSVRPIEVYVKRAPE